MCKRLLIRNRSSPQCTCTAQERAGSRTYCNADRGDKRCLPFVVGTPLAPGARDVLSVASRARMSTRDFRLRGRKSLMPRRPPTGRSMPSFLAKSCMHLDISGCKRLPITCPHPGIHEDKPSSFVLVLTLLWQDQELLADRADSVVVSITLRRHGCSAGACQKDQGSVHGGRSGHPVPELFRQCPAAGQRADRACSSAGGPRRGRLSPGSPLSTGLSRRPT